MQKEVEHIDKETGEVLGKSLVYYPTRMKLSERWFMLFQDSLESIAKDKELTLEPKNILFYLYSKLEFENFIQQSQTDIAEALGMQRGNVSRAMKILIKKKIILEDKKNGRLKYYRLNPDYGWKGKIKHLQNLRRDQLKVIKGGKADNV